MTKKICPSCNDDGTCNADTKPTPTPWHIRKTFLADNGCVYLTTIEGGTTITSEAIGTIDISKANAAFIVRAVNNHKFLIDSLQEIGLQLERGSSTMAIQKTVREAITKATEGQI